MGEREYVTALPSPGWQKTAAALARERRHSLLLGGSLFMLISSMLVSGMNFVFNLVVARLLGPEDFGHVSVAATLLMLTSAITLSFQTVTAKFVAKNETLGAKAAVFANLRKSAWLVGSLVGAALIAGSGPLTSYLRLPTQAIVILLAFGLTFYAPLGVKRGGLQGLCAFPRLSGNFLFETAVKLISAVVLIEIGFGVLGAVGAIAISVALAYFWSGSLPELRQEAESCQPASLGEGVQAISFFVGKVLITNIDILLVKHFFPPVEAGIYAAVALVGRFMYFASWSLVSAMFPIAAGTHKQESDRQKSVMLIPLGLVFLFNGAIVLILALLPKTIIGLLFGPVFQQVGGGQEALLSLYAVATGMYSLAAVLMMYEMSRKIANTSWVQLIFAGLVVVGISLFHSSLYEVVMVQLVLMASLLMAVSLPFFRTPRLQEAV
jgi:O-antigen/teichoic acid export membrane protein